MFEKLKYQKKLMEWISWCNYYLEKEQPPEYEIFKLPLDEVENENGFEPSEKTLEELFKEGINLFKEAREKWYHVFDKECAEIMKYLERIVSEMEKEKAEFENGMQPEEMRKILKEISQKYYLQKLIPN